MVGGEHDSTSFCHILLHHDAASKAPPAAELPSVSSVLKDTVHYSVSVVVGCYPVVVASKITEQSAVYGMIVTILASPTVPLAKNVSLPLPLLEIYLPCRTLNQIVSLSHILTMPEWWINSPIYELQQRR
eukprot:scaffold316431_cov20-Attheya_sp.AAC.1